MELDVEPVADDRARDDPANHLFALGLDIHNAINLRKSRTAKKDLSRQVWLALETQPWHASLSAGKHHALGRSRCVRVVRYVVKADLTAGGRSLKRLARLHTGVPLRTPVYP